MHKFITGFVFALVLLDLTVAIIDGHYQVDFFFVILVYICLIFAFISQMKMMGDQELGMIEALFIVFQDALGGFEAPSTEKYESIWLRMTEWANFLML